MRQNMSRRNLLNMENMVIGKVIPAERLGLPHTEDDLTKIVCTFNYEKVLVNLCRINLLFHRSKDILDDERVLKEAFCDGTILNAIDASTDIRNDFVFSRQGTLRMFDQCACFSDSESANTIVAVEGMNDLAKAYLIVNGLLNTDSSPKSTSDPLDERNMLVNSIPFQEYSINEAPEVYTKHIIVRSKEFLRLLQEDTSKLNINDIFFQTTGLTLQKYQNLILLIFTYYWNYTAEEICRQDILEDKSLFFNPNGQSDDFTPLYQKLLPLISVSIDDLKNKVPKNPKFIDEFLLWRDKPLLKINEDRVICVDFTFLLDKLLTGAYWFIRKRCLSDKKEKGTFERLWGDVFENYAASIIQRGFDAQNSSKQERFIIKPIYDQKGIAECADVAVCCDDTLILFECKSTILSAECKFNGDFNKFDNGIKSVNSGIKQLGRAVQNLGNSTTDLRKYVKDIDICKIKNIYPVLVLSDRIFSGLFMNHVLDLKFQSEVQHNYLMKHIKVMPLTVLTIIDLELLEPYIQNNPLHTRLDEWLDFFENNNRRLGFNAYLFDLRNKILHSNEYMDQEFEQIAKEGQGFLSSHGVS